MFRSTAGHVIGSSFLVGWENTAGIFIGYTWPRQLKRSLLNPASNRELLFWFIVTKKVKKDCTVVLAVE